MSNRFNASLLVLLTSLVLAGCQKSRSVASRPLAEPIAIRAHHHGSDPALNMIGFKLVRSARQWAALGAPTLAGADVDFTESDVVLLSLGEQRTGGHWVCISGAQVVGDVVYVQGVANRPGPDEVLTQGLTYPYCAAVIEKSAAIEVRSDITSVVGHSPPQ